jgi:MYXO-CTERM domain-containing protein
MVDGAMALAAPSPTNQAIGGRIEWFIQRYEPEYLCKLLGEELYNDFLVNGKEALWVEFKMLLVDEASKVSGSENAWMYLYDNGKFINEGKMEMNLYVSGGELTALDGATFGDIYADAGTITVEGTVNADSLTLASAADVDAQLKLVLGAGASLNVDYLAGFENFDEIIITIDNYTDGMIISSGHQYIVGADADTKVTVVDSEGNVLATNVAISTVPEPATATLSLLALAALAARRRRR